MRQFLLATVVAVWAVGNASAGSICPASTAPTPFAHNPDNGATGCNTVITINANGTVTTTVNDSAPYDLTSGGEDVLVGVVNNSSTAVGSLGLTGSGGNSIFGFDGDGICTYTFTGNSYCSASQKAGTDPGDYQGPTSSFSNISSNGVSGTVNFSPAIAANGGTTYFSLEGLPTASIGVVVGPGTPAVPAPSSITLLAVGFAVLLLNQVRRKFARQS